jgi:elongation factor 1-alpha
LTSAKTRQGYDLLEKLITHLPEKQREIAKPLLMYIDKVYNITGVGTVVSGTIKQGKIEIGKEVLLGPFGNEFKKVKITSIQTHYKDVKEVHAGFIVGVALRGIKANEVRRGMVLVDKTLKIKPVRSFEADVFILTHPTKITNGYEPVLHYNTISQAVKIKLLDKEYLKAGESGRVLMKFKYKPEVVFENDKFIFREGKTKGIGTTTKVLK